VPANRAKKVAFSTSWDFVPCRRGFVGQAKTGGLRGNVARLDGFEERRISMKIRILMGLLSMTWAMSLPVVAQEAQQQEKSPKRPEQLPAPEELAPADCTPPCPDFKILWLEYDVPITRLVPREVISQRKSPTFEVAYRDETREVCETLLRPREVDRVISCITQKEVTEIDPSCGQPVTVKKPVVETRTVKETEYYAVPVTRKVTVKVPYLKQAEEIVTQKTVLLEYRTEMQKQGYALRARGGEVLPDRMIAAPNACEAEAHLPCEK
jgi:hypothetical protein